MTPSTPHHDPQAAPRGGRAAAENRRLFAVSAGTLVLLAIATPWIARSALGLLSVDSTTPIEWVPATFPPRQAYAEFTREFGSGDVVVASWPGCTLGAPAIDRFIEAATGAGAPCDSRGERWFESVIAGTEAVDRLTSPPLSLDRDTAIERLTGVLIGPDGRQTCLVVAFTRAGLADRRRATAWIRDTLLQ
ncbi:MAG: hypothetical protein WCO99_12125, partial [Planctomycetota bacterium]